MLVVVLMGMIDHMDGNTDGGGNRLIVLVDEGVHDGNCGG